MPRWFWKLLWGSQVINWFVTIWAYGTPNGSCLLAPAFTIAWVLKDEIAECYITLFTDDWEYEEEEECNSVVIDNRRYDYYELRKGA